MQHGVVMQNVVMVEPFASQLDALVVQVLPMSQLSRDSGIPEGTLDRWLKRAARMPDMAKAPGRRTESEDPQVTDRSDRRRTGALEQWRKLAEQALQGDPKRLPPSKEIRRLQAELARKEKPLAEAAALIILKKNGCHLGGRGRRHGRDERDIACVIAYGASRRFARREPRSGHPGGWPRVASKLTTGLGLS